MAKVSGLCRDGKPHFWVRTKNGLGLKCQLCGKRKKSGR